MENRTRNLFLIATAVLLLFTPFFGANGVAWGAENQLSKQEQVIQPDIKRRKVELSRVKRQDFEIAAYAGLMNVEDFDVNPVYSIRLDYHLTEKFFLQTALGTTSVGLSSFERLNNVRLLTDTQRDLTYYNISLGYNLLPGEAFFGRKRAYNTAFYLIAGIGGTRFAGDTRYTLNIGAGYRLLLTDRIALHIDLRDHLFDMDLFGQNKTTHNVEATLGIGYFF